MSQLGLQKVECRLSDKVNFIDQSMEIDQKNALYEALKEDGMGVQPKDEDAFIQSLVDKGLSFDEASRQYATELMLFKAYTNESWLTYAPNMKISFGLVKR